jgi:hypothetical protein
MWPIWAILLVAAGAFILLNLLRNKEEMRRRHPPVQGRARGTEDNPDGTRQAPVTDLDRFLQEVHRRRRVAEGEESGAQPVRRPVESPASPRRSTPAPVPRAYPGPSRRAPRSGERPTARRPSAAPVEVIPLAIPVEDPASRSWARSGPEPSATVFPASPQPLPAVRAVQSVEASRSPARKGNSFLALLNSRQALRNAIVLREILDPPLCKRQPRYGK